MALPRRWLLAGAILASAGAAAREPGAEAPCWGDEAAWDTTSPSFLEQGQVQGDPWSQIGSTFGSGVEWLFKLMPGMRGKLYGRSLTPPCRCEGARRPPPSGTLPQGPLCRQHTRISGRDSWRAWPARVLTLDPSPAQRARTRWIP